MKIRNKILLVISLAWVVFLGLTYLGSKYFLIQSFLSLEKERVEKDLSRIDQAIDQINYSLYTFTSDWSHWNDLYQFMQGSNPQFVANNINIPAAITANVNFMTFWGMENNLVMGYAIDTTNKQIISYDKGLKNYIFPGSPVFIRNDVMHDLSGYILTERGIMFIAACSITDGDRILPPLGTAIFGRNLSQAIVDRINTTTKLETTLLLPMKINADVELKDIFAQTFKDKNGHLSVPLSNEQIAGYTIIKDILNKPIGMFRMNSKRAIYLTGIDSIRYYLLTLVMLGVLFSMLILWLLQIMIIKRLERLDTEVALISEKRAIRQRVDASGNDELTSVASEINNMLNIIQSSQEQLENRVEERTIELKQTNVQLQDEISERKAVEHELTIHKEHLIRLAHYDLLTGLPNRVFFNEILNKAISHASRANVQLAILFIDLDRFKTINDALGHTIGDLVLKEMSNRFTAILRTGDTLARLGGDEFIVLLNNIDSIESVTPIAEKIIMSSKMPVKIEGHEFFIGASVGISVYPTDGMSMESLQKNADMAMYKSKHAGGGVYHFYTNDMDTAANEYIKMEAALRKAVQNEEFVLYFQPQLNIKDGKVKRLEALIRWEDPRSGLVSPGSFIPLAEATGLIMPIGKWALNEACRINRQWQDEGYDPVIIAVNISPKQFHHQDIAQIVKEALSLHNIDPKYLEVEITESAVMENVEDAIAKLTIIREMGVHISIDDFGTGYTSISYLRQYPVSVLKIDQTFIKGLPANQNDAAITSAVIALGHNLGLEIVAEGVETAEQLKYLAEHNCDFIQGYYYSRPLSQAKIIQVFTKNDVSIHSID